MLRLFLVLLAALPILAAMYGFVQRRTTSRQLDLRNEFEPKLELHFSGRMRWLPYLTMIAGGGIGSFAYSNNPLGGISVLVMVDVAIGCYAWFVWEGPSVLAQREYHLHGAGEIGEIARDLMAYNDETYVKYRRDPKWLKGVKAPANRMAADDDVDYVLRLIWTLVAERYAAVVWQTWARRIERERLKDEAVVAVEEAWIGIERILAMAEEFPGLAIKPGLLDWDIPALKPSTPST